MVLGLALVFTLPGLSLSYDKNDPMIIKCGIDNPPQDMKAVTIKKLGDMVEQGTDGRVQFKYFYGGSLIKKPQFIDAVAKGIADLSTGPISFVTGKIPELSIFEIYGAYKLEQTNEMADAVMPTLIELLADKGVRPLLVQYSGSVIFPHKSKFLKTPADWKGQKMRLGGKWQSYLGKEWGASPVFMPPNDLYVAVQRGVIDGFMLIWDIVYGLKLYEVAPYIIDSNFSNNIEIITMNLKKWNELTDEDRQVFLDALEEIKPWTYDETLKYYEKIKQDVLAKGGKIHTLTPEEKSLYLKDSLAVWPKVREESGPIGNKFADILENFRDE
jgi:TRAP-type C4-dicarboxylate transport system substrate-binding protein